MALIENIFLDGWGGMSFFFLLVKYNLGTYYFSIISEQAPQLFE